MNLPSYILEHIWIIVRVWKIDIDKSLTKSRHIVTYVVVVKKNSEPYILSQLVLPLENNWFKNIHIYN